MSVERYPVDSPAAIIVHHLQRHGRAGVRELAEVLGVSATAVRDHLVHLQADGMVSTATERSGPGRPRIIYTLSDKALKGFPKQYDRLISGLLRELIADDPPERVAQLLDRVSRRLAAEYAGRMEATGMRERLAELRQLLEQRGVPAELSAGGDALEVYACPFYDVAADHPEVCVMERRMLEYVVGQPVDVESGIRAGAHTCRFVVRPNDIALVQQPAAPQQNRSDWDSGTL